MKKQIISWVLSAVMGGMVGANATTPEVNQEVLKYYECEGGEQMSVEEYEEWLNQ